jgi:endonuclease/exonuclease/phosphatase family metal-dependent hydrolase
MTTAIPEAEQPVPGRARMARCLSRPGGWYLRVATLNLFGRQGAWADRRSVLREGLRELRPDLVAFQEAIVTDDYDQVVDLLGPGFSIAHQAGREANGSGCSIASRWPLGDVREVDLFVTPRVDPGELGSRTAVAEVHSPDPIGPLLFVNHKPSFRLGFEHERELQAVTAARFVEELVGERRLHVGCDHGPTLDITACAQIFNQPGGGVWASDHFGVMADLAVPAAGDPCWG